MTQFQILTRGSLLLVVATSVPCFDFHLYALMKGCWIRDMIKGWKGGLGRTQDEWRAEEKEGWWDSLFYSPFRWWLSAVTYEMWLDACVDELLFLPRCQQPITACLLSAAFFGALGSSFIYGYNLSVVNAPAAVSPCRGAQSPLLNGKKKKKVSSEFFHRDPSTERQTKKNEQTHTQGQIVGTSPMDVVMLSTYLHKHRVRR